VLGDAVPFGYAFGVGMAAAVNPCGFALLPTYLGLYLGSAAGDQRAWPSQLGRALLISASMTASFVALFGAAGLVVGVAGAAAVPHSLLVRWSPRCSLTEYPRRRPPARRLCGWASNTPALQQRLAG
jgi:cytochrome c biogenesis protein CcdA